MFLKPILLSAKERAAQRRARQDFWRREYAAQKGRYSKFLNDLLAVLLLTAIFFWMAMMWID